MPKLSAGRVQSVATRLVVERERERIAFVPASYWDLAAAFDTGKSEQPSAFAAALVAVGGRRVAQGRDFSAQGQIRSAEILRLDEAAAQGLAERLRERRSRSSVERKPYKRSPYAPFRTTTLQQEAGRKLRLRRSADAGRAGAVRDGFITYMRTDSVTLSETAINAARSQVATAVRRRLHAGRAARLQEQGQERPGGARGDPPGRRDVPYAGRDRPEGRPVPALRADLEAHHRLADEGRRGVSRSRSRVARPRHRRRDRRFGASGTTITFHGFLRPTSRL